MSTSRMALIALLIVLGTGLALPAAGQTPPPTCSVTTSWSFVPFPPPNTPPTPIIYSSIQAAVNSAPSGLLGGTVTVSGVCTEPEVFIGDRFVSLNLIGLPGATLQATDPPPPSGQIDYPGGAMTIRGRSITVRGLRMIPAAPQPPSQPAKYGLTVNRGGTAIIDNCVIEGFAGGAITVNQFAFARIINNTLQNNGEDGIFVSENSSVRVGFTSTDDPAPQPNRIRNNGLFGIRVTRTSNARITANEITNNRGDGILVENNSHADIAWNELSGNTGAGIRVHLNSSARVGIGAGRDDWNNPNSSITPNLGAGLECTLGGAVEGTLGTLSGEKGRHKFGHGCVHDLTK
jgi:parallel beta-helix repeat protein